MDKREEVRQEVDRIMESMDGMEKLAAGPYFYTRVEARLKSRREEERKWMPGQSASRRVLRPAFLALLVLVNVISGIIFLMGPAVVQTETIKQEKPLQAYISGLTEGNRQRGDSYDDIVTQKLIGGESK